MMSSYLALILHPHKRINVINDDFIVSTQHQFVEYTENIRFSKVIL